MSDGSDRRRERTPDVFVRAVSSKAARKLRARNNPGRGVWFGLGMMGLIGWSVVVPMLLGAALGVWLDSRHPGRYSWTLTLLISGLCFGCLNAWRWVTREGKEIQKEQEDHDE